MYSLCQCVTIISCVAEHEIAVVAEDASDVTGGMAVVYKPLAITAPGFVSATNGALTTLRGNHLVALLYSDAVGSLEMPLSVSRVLFLFVFLITLLTSFTLPSSLILR
jgi:hypothetical protein